MLPSGVHCEGCHRLVRVEEAWAGMDGWDFESVFDLELLIPLLLAHAELDCSAHDRMLEQYRIDPHRYTGLRPID